MALGSTAARLAWVDATRGYCVAAVVLFHVVLWHVAVLPDVAPAGQVLWAEVNSVLGGVRMPVLMAVSGLVLSRQVRDGLHRSTTVFRAANNLYLYVVWLLVYVGFYAVVGAPSLPHRVDGWEVAAELVAPDTTLWYVFALAVYVPVLAVARRVPGWLVLLVLTGLTVAVLVAELPDVLWAKIPEYFVFFAAGVHAAGPLRRLAATATARRLAVAAALAVGVTLGGRLPLGDVGFALLFVVRGAAFAVLAVLAVSIAVRWAPARAVGEALGRRSLAIYVLHPLLLALVIVSTAGPLAGPVQRLVATTPGGLVYPLGLTAAVVVLAMVLQTAGERAGLGFLFEAPARMRAAFGRPVAVEAAAGLTAPRRPVRARGARRSPAPPSRRGRVR